MWKGFILKYGKGQGLLCKWYKRWEDSKKRKKARGLWAKLPCLLPLPPCWKIEERGGLAGGGPTGCSGRG